MTLGLTPPEKLVAGLCECAFFRLWTHPDPKREKGKELCDCPIVCGPHVVIIPVKDNEYRETGDKTGWERWTKVTIDKLIAQIQGVERWLDTVETVEHMDGRTMALPLKNQRWYHRIAVTLGSRGEAPFTWGDSGTGFVHVCDEFSVGALFLVLDAITGFMKFLQIAEELMTGGMRLLFSGGGLEDFVALYLLHDRSFNFDSWKQDKTDVMLILHNDIRKGMVEPDELKCIGKDLENPYVQDRLIDLYTKDPLTGGMFDIHSQQAIDNEFTLVTMAIQSRVRRSFFAEALLQFLNSSALKSVAGVAQGYADTAFVFTASGSSDREQRSKELFLRCLMVRGKMPGVRTVVGIAIGRPGIPSIGYLPDIVYICPKEWSDRQTADVDGIQRDFGYFQNVSWTGRQGMPFLCL